MLKASYTPYILHFKVPSGTSRGVLTQKETYFLKVWDEHNPDCFGIGECALFKGLGADDRPDYEAMLQTVCRGIDRIDEIDLSTWSSIRFGVETALLDLQHGGRRMIYPSEFTAGKQAIEINGLIWMGDKRTMASRIDEKLAAGFSCIKLKIGAIDFDDECELLAAIRRRYRREDIELRVDANGAFSPYDALEHLQRLSAYDLHSIEQPIRAGQWEAMARLCEETPLIGDDFSAIYRFEAFFDRGIFGCGRVDRICSELSCGLVDNIGIGIECGIECNCAMDGDIAYKYASGIGNGSFVHQ